MGQGEKHHYVPRFYLKQWVGRDARICEFSPPYREVKPRMTHPDGTGCLRGHYTFSELPPAAANFLERRFLDFADKQANTALQQLLINNVELEANNQSGWSRFIMSLIHRTPRITTNDMSRKSLAYAMISACRFTIESSGSAPSVCPRHAAPASAATSHP
jgi:hypothetical protein